mgnify:CR=1 FL=1
MRILIAEDQPELRRMLVKNLTAVGYTVDGVPDGAEALAYLDAAAYDAAVLDIMMPKVDGLTVLGGEPFEPENQRDLLPFLREVRRRYPGKTIWCFTGFRLEDELLREGSHPRCAVTDDLLSCIDVLVDGRFVAAEKDISLQFRGSRNQRVLDLPKTLAAGQPVIWEKLKK